MSTHSNNDDGNTASSQVALYAQLAFARCSDAFFGKLTSFEIVKTELAGCTPVKLQYDT